MQDALTILLGGNQIKEAKPGQGSWGIRQNTRPNTVAPQFYRPGTAPLQRSQVSEAMRRFNNGEALVTNTRLDQTPPQSVKRMTPAIMRQRLEAGATFLPQSSQPAPSRPSPAAPSRPAPAVPSSPTPAVPSSPAPAVPSNTAPAAPAIKEPSYGVPYPTPSAKDPSTGVPYPTPTTPWSKPAAPTVEGPRINPLTGKPFGGNASENPPPTPTPKTAPAPRLWNATSGEYQDLPKDYSTTTEDEYQAAVGRKNAPAQSGLSSDQQRSQDYQDMRTRVGFRNAQDERKLTMLRYLRSQGADVSGPGWENDPRQREAIRNVVTRGYGQFLDPGTLQTALRLGLDQPLTPRYGRVGQDTYAGWIPRSSNG